MHSVHQVLDPLAVRDGIHSRQENGPGAAEDEESHAGLLGRGPPLVRLLEVDEGVDGKAQFYDGEGEDDHE